MHIYRILNPDLSYTPRDVQLCTLQLWMSTFGITTPLFWIHNHKYCLLLHSTYKNTLQEYPERHIVTFILTVCKDYYAVYWLNSDGKMHMSVFKLLFMFLWVLPFRANVHAQWLPCATSYKSIAWQTAHCACAQHIDWESFRFHFERLAVDVLGSLQVSCLCGSIHHENLF